MRYLVRIKTTANGHTTSQTMQAVDAVDANHIRRRLNAAAIPGDSKANRRECIVCVSIPTRNGSLVIPEAELRAVYEDIGRAIGEVQDEYPRPALKTID